MRGSLRERKPGVWELRVGAGRDGRGRYRQISRTIRGPRAVAEGALAQLAARSMQPVSPSEPREPEGAGGTVDDRESAVCRPYAFEALEALLGRPSVEGLALLLGVHGRQVYRWRASGLTEHQADRLAIAGGLHPGDVWPAWWTVTEVAQREDAGWFGP